MTILALIIYLVIALIYGCLGAYFIKTAVERFKNQHYFLFGLNVICAIILITNVVLLVVGK